MTAKDDSNDKVSSAEGVTCKSHDICSEEEEEILKGVVDSFRRLDGLPLIEADDGRTIIVNEFKAKPEKDEEIEYIITARHGNVMHARRVEN